MYWKEKWFYNPQHYKWLEIYREINITIYFSIILSSFVYGILLAIKADSFLIWGACFIAGLISSLLIYLINNLIFSLLYDVKDINNALTKKQSSTWKCPCCGNINLKKQNKCAKCNYELDINVWEHICNTNVSWKCPDCGKENPINDPVCQFCYFIKKSDIPKIEPLKKIIEENDS